MFHGRSSFLQVCIIFRAQNPCACSKMSHFMQIISLKQKVVSPPRVVVEAVGLGAALQYRHGCGSGVGARRGRGVRSRSSHGRPSPSARRPKPPSYVHSHSCKICVNDHHRNCWAFCRIFKTWGQRRHNCHGNAFWRVDISLEMSGFFSTFSCSPVFSLLQQIIKCKWLFWSLVADIESLQFDQKQ